VILDCNHPTLGTAETENDLKLKNEAEECKLHRMAKVHDLLEIWQCNQTLRATQTESRAENTQMPAEGYISEPEEIVKASWSNFQHDGVAASELLDRSPLPPALSARDLPGRHTQILNVHCR